jgi:glutathione S-transferase
VRFFIDVVVRDVQTPMFEIRTSVPGAVERLIEGLEKVQTLLPDPDAAEGGEYAVGKDFTNADCAIVPLLAFVELAVRTDLGKPGTGEKLGEALAGVKFERFRRYKKALWERESVKKVIDLVSYLSVGDLGGYRPFLVFRSTWRAYGGLDSLATEERYHGVYVLKLS